MKEYRVQIEINGVFREVGFLRGESFLDTCFGYSHEYLCTENPLPVSISLPLQKEPFFESETKSFFDGLLPEGFTRQVLASRIREDAEDYIGMLSIIGRECIGAIRIDSAEDADLSQGYTPIGKDLIKALAAEGSSVSTEIISNTHLSLAGASGKVGLFYNKENGTWYMPCGISPSTHIVKQSHVRLQDIVVNEALCMETARRCGIDVPDTSILTTGGRDDGSVLLVSKRFDRYENGYGDDGFPRVYRLHQEDFAQALGIPSVHKYEKQGDDYMNRMFRLLVHHSANPIEDQIKLFRAVAFNCLIGNTDAHLKNYSLLYSKELLSKRLSPMYDLLCTRYYESASRDLSININGKYNINDISYNDLIESAANAGIGRRLSCLKLDSLLDKFETAVSEAKYDLLSQGYNKAETIAECILQGAKKILL